MRNLIIVLALSTSSLAAVAEAVTLPLSANAWVRHDPEATLRMITPRGLRNWVDTRQQIDTWVWVPKAGEITVSLQGTARHAATFTLSLGDQHAIIKTSRTHGTLTTQRFRISEPGYHAISLQGQQHSRGAEFAAIDSIRIEGEPISRDVHHIRDEVYWGRRGPSVHLNYAPPDPKAKYEWFYNEVTVPEGFDTVGSFFMAAGFGQGYFGMQVNSPTERRVLFSVWSPFQTDNPAAIPPDKQVKLLAKGPEVKSGEFGNEGSGGQSLRRFNWKTGATYRFLLRIRPDDQQHTEYTAWFTGEGVDGWQLMARFSRPDTSTWLQHPHSFLENFIPETGDTTRQAYYGTPWVRTHDGDWEPAVQARFTYDDTAKRGNRLDYAGGVENGRFFLRNTGFFNGGTLAGTLFTLPHPGQAPDLLLEHLPR
ncbi:DUF3472 domain-containing protein [Burkholderiaceae bacterium DAT-1]|nr:DUF3472 domain-containing protein [Burkholderiaceae bacterium DAT-1]